MWTLTQNYVRPECWFNACQRRFYAGEARVSSVIILKLHDDNISGQWGWSKRHLGSWPLFKAISGYIRSHAFLLMTSYRAEIEQCGWLIVFNWSKQIEWYTYWLCSVTTQPWGHVTWGHLKSNFVIDIPGSTTTAFRTFWREKHDDVRVIASAFFVRKLFKKKTYGHFRSLTWHQRSTVVI